MLLSKLIETILADAVHIANPSSNILSNLQNTMWLFVQTLLSKVSPRLCLIAKVSGNFISNAELYIYLCSRCPISPGIASFEITRSKISANFFFLDWPFVFNLKVQQVLQYKTNLINVVGKMVDNICLFSAKTTSSRWLLHTSVDKTA